MVDIDWTAVYYAYLEGSFGKSWEAPIVMTIAEVKVDGSGTLTFHPALD
ncbi:hypothetical protein L248_1537 [Schleiferilactobacillus shenzhenensis LY-73]|uniref:Uncharacterized protein n=1 Tax=Schleiferilactobacillus shenzhenensis LY-73 TaxID=1231336 RepID=U4TH88_9LACO|nr:hypothetical protein L248_1537 [Schleiferilactobacillus shenzhenensis LY-73]